MLLSDQANKIGTPLMRDRLAAQYSVTTRNGFDSLYTLSVSPTSGSYSSVKSLVLITLSLCRT